MQPGSHCNPAVTQSLLPRLFIKYMAEIVMGRVLNTVCHKIDTSLKNAIRTLDDVSTANLQKLVHIKCT